MLPKLSTTEVDLIMLYRGYIELAQAYHIHCNLMHPDRHIASNDYQTCEEETCKLHYRLIKLLGLE